MNPFELMKERHSVRQYQEKQIEPEKRKQLQELVNECNRQSGMHIQILFDEPKCFSSAIAHYGSFRNVNHYIALVGKKSPDLEEQAGYYGEKIVLKAQELGLNTCWVALTHGKSAAKIEKGEKQVVLITLGYGAVNGKAHKNKELSALCDLSADSPDWYRGRNGCRDACSYGGEPAKVLFLQGRREGDRKSERDWRMYED
jgi:hypothetical protein